MTLTPTPSQLNLLVNSLYQARQLRLTNPEGTLDKDGLWQPSEAEDADGEARKVSPPHKGMRYSYQIHCRSKAHVRLLVGRAMQGLEVPKDIARGWDTLARSMTTTVKGKPKAVTVAPEGPPPVAKLTNLLLEFGMWMEREQGRKSAQS